MAKAPQVETLAKSMAMLDPGYNEQRGLINEQMEGLGAQSQVRRDRLEGAKVSSFNQINDQALGRGVGAAFSGIPIHEQTDYLASQYLPGMQDIEMMEGQERMQLRGTLADLNLQQRNAAIGRIDQQKQALNQWNLQQAQIEAQRRESALNRQFQTSERVASQGFTASQNAANRAAQAANQGPSASALHQTAIGILTGEGARGSDGKVSPETFQKALNEYINAGGTPNDFRTAYSGYANLADRPGRYGYY